MYKFSKISQNRVFGNILTSFVQRNVKLWKTRIFFWKKRYFFYTVAMSKFKVKKLPNHPITPIKSLDSNEKIKKRLRIFVATLLSIFLGFFVFELIAWSLGNIRLSTNTEIVFNPIIFGWSGVAKIDKEQKNILIAWIGWPWHEWSNLTDSLMLARLDSEKNTITLLSIPRDLYVSYPNKSSGRINSLYGMTYGEKKGINLLAEKVSEITWQPIHHYVVIDFTGFKYIVNALGGIDIDVPKDVVDREYPNDNWGYTTFIVRQWVQTFDWETALKYARSRHSTSDFDRSERQQLLIKAIKDKALSIDFLTSPTKIQEVLQAIRSHLDTDLTVAHLLEFGSIIQNIGDEGISVYNIGNNCSGLACSAWAFLYNPAREYFDGASVLIPENASVGKLSYYADISRFTEFVFRFPQIRQTPIPLKIVYQKGGYDRAKQIAIGLKKMGFQFQNEHLFVESTGSIDSSKILFYNNPELHLGWNDSDMVVQAFRFIEEKIPYTMSPKNEHVTTDWPKIELILWKDAATYFTYTKPAYYMPYIPLASGEVSNERSGSTISSEIKSTNRLKSTPKDTSRPIQKNENEYSIAPGEWENF